MQITCHQTQIAQAINIVSKAISSKSTQPILTGIYIETLDHQIKLIGNDLNLSIETTIDARIERKGQIVIPARLFTELIKKLPQEDITIHVDEHHVVTLHCLKSSYKIIGLPGEEYPALPIIQDKDSFTMDHQLFSHMIRQTHFAISHDESRPILMGALLEIGNRQFNMVAIDGFRMAIRNINVQTDLEKKAVVPGRTLNEIQKLLSPIDDQADLKISFDDNQVLFSIQDIKIYSRLLAGEFINYKQILPTEFKSVVKVDTHELLQSIDRSFLLARENKNIVIKMNIKDDELKITSQSEMGSSNENVPIRLEGLDLEIGFNPKYLMDALKMIDSEYVELKFINNVSPCIINPCDSDHYTYLVLPCRVAN